MNFEFKLPDIGEGTVEGEIVKWMVKPGDPIVEDQPMVEVMTDKATVVLPSPRNGKVLETRGKEGDIAKVGSVIVVIAVNGAGAAPAATAKPAAAVGAAESPTAASVPAVTPAAATSSPVTVSVAAQTPTPSPQPPTPSSGPRPLATPATRKLARERGLELTSVPPTGRNGQVTREDVMRAAAGGHISGQLAAASPSNLAQAAMAVSAPGALGPSAALAASMAKVPAKAIPSTTTAAGSVREERIPFRGLRKKIAEKMHQSKTTAAHFTYVEECDFTALSEMRESLKPRAAEYGIKLTYLPFLFKALAITLRRHPKLNSMLDEKAQEWVIKHFYNIGISVDTPNGLIVPIVKQVESRSILSIASELQRVADEARAGKSKLEDLQGGTFTVTSVGNIGGVLATPIINFPEVAILGLNKIADRPVVRDGQIVIRKMAYLAITLDHRLVDGADGARFMTDLVGMLENPGAMLLELA